MSKSRRKQESDISRIVGILFLELLGAILLLNLASIAEQERSQLAPKQEQVQQLRPWLVQQPRPWSQQPELLEKTLPKVAGGRYNARW